MYGSEKNVLEIVKLITNCKFVITLKDGRVCGYSVDDCLPKNIFWQKIGKVNVGTEKEIDDSSMFEIRNVFHESPAVVFQDEEIQSYKNFIAENLEKLKNTELCIAGLPTRVFNSLLRHQFTTVYDVVSKYVSSMENNEGYFTTWIKNFGPKLEKDMLKALKKEGFLP